MFSTVNHFQMFKPGSVSGRHGRCKFKQGNQSKASKSEMAKEATAHIKRCKKTQNKTEYQSTYSLSFSQKIFRCNSLYPFFGGRLQLSRSSGFSTTQKVTGLIPTSFGLHIEASLAKTMNPKLLWMNRIVCEWVNADQCCTSILSR